MKLIVFDLFGTLIEHQIRNSPYRTLIEYGRSHSRPVRENDARQIMSLNLNLRGIASQLGIVAPNNFLSELEQQINEEIEALTLFDDVYETLTSLADSKMPIAICSNLAQPYGRAVDNLLNTFSLHKFLSYELGCIKPDQEIYQKISETINLHPKQILLVGDNKYCDYLGPMKFGFQARHLIRQGSCGGGEITNLKSVMSIVKSQRFS
ncbi:MAG: HAD family hydrolase [Gammaproteobacteria bacterium]|nr:MAG: HAD family hydrolase [Gammaproteobacteria bacterium]